MAHADGGARRRRRAVAQDRQQRPHVPVRRAQRGGAPPAHPRQPVPARTAAPRAAAELDYLRLDEIEGYLDACADFYRPLAEVLIGTGARISEALALMWPD